MLNHIALKYLVFLCVIFLFGASETSAKPKKILVRSSPIHFSLFQPNKILFDKLIFRGGLELSSKNKNFGGLSGLVLSRDGRKMIAVSDRGRWFGGELLYEDGKIRAIKNVLYDRLRDTNGGILRGKGNKDAESIAAAWGGKLGGGVLVAFERREKLYFYKVRGTRILSPAIKLALPNKIKNGPHNKEFESVVRYHKGRLKGKTLIFSENHRDEKGNILGWILSKEKQSLIRVKPVGSFSITDAAILPNGDLLLLERSVSRLTGLSMQIRLIKENNIKAGALLEGEVLLQASQLNFIDNMEGMAIHRDQQGRVIISLISDDNFETFQRTLLLQFEIPKEVFTLTGAKK